MTTKTLGSNHTTYFCWVQRAGELPRMLTAHTFGKATTFFVDGKRVTKRVYQTYLPKKPKGRKA